MAASFTHNILFSSVIIFFIGFQNVAIANQNIDFNLSPSNAYVDKTTTFTIEFISSQNLSNGVISFYVDDEKKGTKNLFYIEKNKKNFITFDYFFNKNSYLGEHYIELKIDFIAENQEKGSETLYAVINVYGKKDNFSLITFIYVITLISIVIHLRYANYSLFPIHPEIRKLIFNSIISLLPVLISFSVLLTERPESKTGMIFILISFITSFTFALYSITLAEHMSEVDANNFTIYSLSFLFVGLIEMILLVLSF